MRLARRFCLLLVNHHVECAANDYPAVGRKFSIIPMEAPADCLWRPLGATPPRRSCSRVMAMTTFSIVFVATFVALVVVIAVVLRRTVFRKLRPSSKTGRSRKRNASKLPAYPTRSQSRGYVVGPLKFAATQLP